ncbi:MAG: carboxypeptidase-like regulatory domain-containing protein [Chitinophagaceae bacterium]
MKKNLLVLTMLCVCFSFMAKAQFTVKGIILDSSSREPLSAASVFCQNTTSGTTSNKQGEFSLNLKSGGYDLIFSYTGYATQTIRIGENSKLEVLLVKEDKSLGEVFIKNSYEVTDGLEKYGDFFIKNFIGSTPNAAQCELINPEVLKFFYYKRSNRLKVLATDALQITNSALGYQLRYQLDSFVYFYNSNINFYKGYCLFTEMEGDDSLKIVWAANRNKAYEGSKLHFMRSYYDSTITEDGWIIDMLDENDDKKFNKVKNVYDTSVYNTVVIYPEITIMTEPELPDSLPVQKVILDSAHASTQVEFFYPRKISITYTKKSPEKEYLKKMNLPKHIPYLISYIDLKDWIAITENGYYYEQKDWINQGYWSWKNLGDLLPYDYLPD